MGCASTKYPTDNEGVLQAQQTVMNKDALRVKGKIIDKAGKVGGSPSYIVEIVEIVRYGDSFARVEPMPGETVLLIAPEGVQFKKNAQVLFDALSPINRSEDRLTLNMVVE